MARSAAQKAADKRYRETHKNVDISWGTRLKPDEAVELDAIIKESGMNRAEFLRWAVAIYKERRGYTDVETMMKDILK